MREVKKVRNERKREEEDIFKSFDLLFSCADIAVK